MTEKNIYRNTAWIYEIEHGTNPPMPDTPFYREYAAMQCGNNGEKGEILELGCGTGRVALALAKDGFNVTGLDLSSQMLDIFRDKLAKETAAQPKLTKQVQIIHGNMADFNIGRKFALITAPFRAFQAITAESDIQSTLACIHRHLTDDGIFIINVFNPNKDPLHEDWCREEIFIGEIVCNETGINIARYECRERIDPINQIIYPYLAYTVTYPSGKTERLVEPLQMKYYYSRQLRAVMEKAGYEIVDEFSWYDKTGNIDEPAQLQPIPQQELRAPNHYASRIRGREIILVCKKKSA
ncbi:MAG: class I SAM-dependent methyltransferase [Defluviitaleaceae bacterium]|nr:class I SAM-dependent methyltransferase [Defluviitaleaceae bacterium]